MPTTLVSYDDWIKHTESLGARRSDELRALDAAIRAYQTDKSAAALTKVKNALAAWKKTQGAGDAWKKSRRNKDGYVELLTTQVDKGGDTDSAWGTTPNFMHENLINARLGVIYLFSHLTVSPRIFNVLLEGGLSIAGGALSYAGATDGLNNATANAVSTYQGLVMVSGNEILDAGWGATKPFILKPDAKTKLLTFMEKVKQWFESVAKGLLESLKEKWKCELPASLVKSAISAAITATQSTLASGLLSGGLDLGKGTLVTVDAAITKFKAWKSSRDVEFSSGHPKMVVDTIHRAMTVSIGEGLWTMMKGAANMGLAAASAGAGLIAGILIAGAEMLAKLFWRLYETSQMRTFFAEAAEHWRNKDGGSALHKQPFAFARWYRKHVLLAPALAVITLNSGICGDKMVYLSMFKDDQSQISSSEFQAGVLHLDALKVWGVKYLSETGFSFGANDAMAGKFLQFAKGGGNGVVQSHQANLSGGALVWDKVLAVAKA
jgi:hypothetical protein